MAIQGETAQGTGSLSFDIRGKGARWTAQRPWNILPKILPLIRAELGGRWVCWVERKRNRTFLDDRCENGEDPGEGKRGLGEIRPGGRAVSRMVRVWGQAANLPPEPSRLKRSKGPGSQAPGPEKGQQKPPVIKVFKAGEERGCQKSSSFEVGRV